MEIIQLIKSELRNGNSLHQKIEKDFRGPC